MVLVIVTMIRRNRESGLKVYAWLPMFKDPVLAQYRPALLCVCMHVALYRHRAFVLCVVRLFVQGTLPIGNDAEGQQHRAAGDEPTRTILLAHGLCRACSPIADTVRARSSSARSILRCALTRRLSSRRCSPSLTLTVSAWTVRSAHSLSQTKPV
jgi:hypothetical protein